MANPEHLKILKQGVDVWNEWREKNPLIEPDLSGANLEYLRLEEIDFNKTNFRKANLTGVYLFWVGLNQSDLSFANLHRATIFVSFAHKAQFIESDLTYANLKMGSFQGANFSSTRTGYTSFNDINFDNTIGLESVLHNAPSSIGIDTIFKSKGNVPEMFLRGCGVPDEFISYARSVVEAGKFLQFYSCFISYSNRDQSFADRLYTDLQNKGVRCWFAPEDIKIGDKFRNRIDESIRIYDKLLLVLSENSVSSQWVEKEVETAMGREREQNKTMLFPVRLDNSVNETKTGWPADVRRTRHIGDFTRWKDHDSYQKAFDRLLRDLKAKEK